MAPARFFRSLYRAEEPALASKVPGSAGQHYQCKQGIRVALEIYQKSIGTGRGLTPALGHL